MATTEAAPATYPPAAAQAPMYASPAGTTAGAIAAPPYAPPADISEVVATGQQTACQHNFEDKWTLMDIACCCLFFPWNFCFCPPKNTVVCTKCRAKAKRTKKSL